MNAPKCKRCARLEDEIRALKSRAVATCPDCKGSGEQEMVEPAPHPYLGRSVSYVECFTCKGRGACLA